MFRGLVTACRTLTVLPVPGRDAEVFARALPWFPLVGGVVGGLLVAIAMGADVLTAHAWPASVAAAVVIADVIVTRGLHYDGLADTADGIGAIRDRARALRIMKDPNVGAFGVLALVMVLGVKWIAVARLVRDGELVWLVVAAVAARAAMVELACALPYARSEGGTAGAFVAGARPAHRWISACVALALGYALVGMAAVAVVALFVAVTGLYRRWCRRRFGGITGDLLGAGGLAVEVAMLCVGGAYGFLLPESPLLSVFALG